MSATLSSTQPATLVGEEEWAVVVKNTFITVASVRDGTQGRPSSLPPSVRLNGAATEHKSTHRQRARTGAQQGSKATGEEDASTEAGSQRGEEDDSTAASTLAEEEQCGDAETETVLDEETGHSALQKTGAASSCILDQVFGPPPPCVGTSSGPRRLNSSAAAWTPSPALVAGPSEDGRRFRIQLDRVVQATRSVLLTLACVAGVETTCSSCGWTVSAKIKQGEFNCKELVLTRAKEAFLMAAEASDNVYLLGYAARPFVTTVVGFSARFAAVPNAHKACWGMLKNGFCQFGNNCRWQHPEHQATVSVLALLDAVQT